LHVLGRTLVSARRQLELRSELTARLERFHDAEPLSPGMPREELRAGLRLPPDVFDALLAQDVEVREDGGRVALQSHRVAAEVERSEAATKLLASLDAAGFRPPLERELDVEPTLIRALVDAGALVRIGSYLLTGARAQEARDAVRARIAERGTVTVAEVRVLLDTTRKYAVPLCEWLDATGATVRRGDERLLGPHP
jgi:selenocysteine-specific elongation factor